MMYRALRGRWLSFPASQTARLSAYTQFAWGKSRANIYLSIYIYTDIYISKDEWTELVVSPTVWLCEQRGVYAAMQRNDRPTDGFLRMVVTENHDVPMFRRKGDSL